MRKRSEASKPPATTGNPAVDELSTKLNQALNPKPPAPPPDDREEDPLFDSPNAPGKPKLGADYAAIVERVFLSNPLEEYERLERELVIGDKRGDYGTVLQHLDRAEENARKAHQLYLSARLERERYTLDADVVEGAMWNKARAALELQKEEGHRSKAPTIEDIKAEVTTTWPDQWREHKLGLARVKATEEHTERMATLWLGRCKSIQVILSTLRK